MTGLSDVRVLVLCAMVLGLVAAKARAELVYENEPQRQAAVAARVDDREATRQVLTNSERAQTVRAVAPPTVIQVQAPTPVYQQQIAQPAPQQAPAPVYIAAAPTQQPAPQVQYVEAPAVEGTHATASELTRRSRVREELRNEDILSQRLEELRLKEEKQRTDYLLGLKGQELQKEVPANNIAPEPPKVEVIAAPLTEQRLADKMNPPAPALASDGALNASTASAKDGDKLQISIRPRFGLLNMLGSSTYTVSPRFATGAAVGLGLADNLAIEAGFTYAEMGVTMNSTNPYVIAYQTWSNSMGNTSSFENAAMKQNVFDVSIKYYLANAEARLRPYVGAGGAYSLGYINYDSKILDYMARSGYGTMAGDYQLSSYLGMLSAGMDVRITKNLSIGADAKYYKVLSSRQSQSATASTTGAQYGAYSGYSYYPGYYAANPYASALSPDVDKQNLSSSFSQMSFYSIMAAMSFTF